MKYWFCGVFSRHVSWMHKGLQQTCYAAAAVLSKIVTYFPTHARDGCIVLLKMQNNAWVPTFQFRKETAQSEFTKGQTPCILLAEQCPFESMVVIL